MYECCKSRPNSKTNTQIKHLILSCLTTATSHKELCKHFNLSITRYEHIASKLQRISFIERNLKKPKAYRYCAATTNESIQFAIKSIQQFQHTTAWSQKVVATSKGGEFVTTSLRNASIVQQKFGSCVFASAASEKIFEKNNKKTQKSIV